jgi:hypothetical protein
MALLRFKVVFVRLNPGKGTVNSWSDRNREGYPVVPVHVSTFFIWPTTAAWFHLFREFLDSLAGHHIDPGF